MDRSEKPTPVGLKRLDAARIEIQWSDGSHRLYRATVLREACPCATCREQRRGREEAEQAVNEKRALTLPVLSLAEAKPLSIEHLRPVGNYAYNIVFGDGHGSGLFTLDFLYQLGELGDSPST